MGVLGEHGATVLAGAACSRVLPTDIPDARTWRRILARSLADVPGSGLDLRAAERLADAKGVTLEAVLGAIEHQVEALGTKLVQAIDVSDDRPLVPHNPVHELVAEKLANNASLTLLTTNFDRCFERALEATGVQPRSWIVGHPPRHDANVLKLHGCVSAPGSLRHTFERVDLGFGSADRFLIQDRARRRLVVLGYAGADPDVLSALSDGDTVWWLVRPPADDRHGARRLAAVREVRIVEGSFDDLLAATGRKGVLMGAGTWLEPVTRKLITLSAKPLDLLVAVSELSFRAMINGGWPRLADARCLEALRVHPGAAERRETHIATGKRRRFRGGGLWWPVAAMLSYRKAARLSKDPERALHASDAADALEMTGFGLLAPLRACMWRWHLKMMRRAPRGNTRAQIAFRVARSALHARRPAVAERLLSRAIDRRAGDMFLGGIAHRWRALANALTGNRRWREDIQRAEASFLFEDRGQELADLRRTEAVCLIIEGSDTQRAQALLRESRRSHLARGDRRGAFRSWVALFLGRRGADGRMILRMLLT